MVQARTAALLGEGIGGWKVERDQSLGVLYGILLQSYCVASGSSLPSIGVPVLGVEAEIAFHLKRDLPARDEP